MFALATSHVAGYAEELHESVMRTAEKMTTARGEDDSTFSRGTYRLSTDTLSKVIHVVEIPWWGCKKKDAARTAGDFCAKEKSSSLSLPHGRTHNLLYHLLFGARARRQRRRNSSLRRCDFAHDSKLDSK